MFFAGTAIESIAVFANVVVAVVVVAINAQLQLLLIAVGVFVLLFHSVFGYLLQMAQCS